ncbi:Sporulation kinase E [Devosia equisanguinis]|uniref:histidine kinase n=1 Tax=Devosia equisanguinis TaxID=2490941 RepID=A0A3S4EKT5_9HYPH|nr:ATP-binding protein [Devosia equisanguinis]VDS04206.1 Sporulation kinase E [Devosia equisanguinis]
MRLARLWMRVFPAGMVILLALAMGYLIVSGLNRDGQLAPAAPPDPAILVGATADFLLDRKTIITIDATTWPEIAARFTPNEGKVPGVGWRYYQGDALWLRFNIPSMDTDQSRWVLRLANTRVEDLRLIIIRDGAFREYDWSYDDPTRRAGLSNRQPVFFFDREDIEGAVGVIGFTARGAMRGSVLLETERGFVAGEVRQAVAYSTLWGILLALAIYLLVIGSRLGEPAMLYAGGLSFFAGTFIFGAGGYIHALLLPNWPNLADVLLYGSQPVMMTFWVLLVVSYLDLRQRNPVLGALLVTLALVLPLQGIFVLFAALGYPVPILTDNATPVLMGIGAGVLTLAYYAIRGDRRALRLLVCFAPVVIFSVVRALLYLTPSPNPAVVAVLEGYLDLVLTMGLLAILIVLDLQIREQGLRKQALRNERRFRQFAEIASDSFFELDGQGRIVSAAGTMARRLGLEEGGDFSGVLVHQVPLGFDTLRRQLVAVQKQGRPARDIEIAIAGSADAPNWVSFNLEPWPGEDGAMGLRGTLTDVTDRVERRLRESRQNTLSALGQLASGVAHEVNNLLHPMVNLAQRVRDKHTEDPEARKLLDLVVASGKRAGEIVAGVLNAFNPGRIPGEKMAVAGALMDALATVRSTLPATIILAESIDESAQAAVPPGEMLQIVSNIIANAVRAMEGSGTIQVTLANEQGLSRLVFADDGPGMPEDLRRRATEPFVSGRAEGTGLGLAVVANIVRNWQGHFDIDSAPGAGTRVVITVPPQLVGEP